MSIRNDARFKNRVVFNISKIVENFPDCLKAKTLAKLDACARKSGAPAIFGLQQDIKELRLALRCYLQFPKFKRIFIDRFADQINKRRPYVVFCLSDLVNHHYLL